MPEPTFTNCQCPECQHPLAAVAIDCKTCPACKRPLDPEKVWLTRRYPGHVMLPGWLRAFGWPFLLVLAGVAILIYGCVSQYPIPLKLPAIILTVGLVFFFARLFTDGEYP